MLNKILALLVAATMTTSVFAQLGVNSTAGLQAGEPSASSLATTACQSTFTSGSGATFLSFCVTANGNVLGFTAPQGFSQESSQEGYGICASTGSTTPPSVSYTDEAVNDSGNWLPSTITQPNGVNKFPLTIVRVTSDGLWQLKQTFSRNTSDRYVKVVMALTNLSGIAKNVNLLRYMDVNGDGATTNYFDAGKFSVWGYAAANGNNHGVMLAALPSIFNFLGYAANPGGYDGCGAYGSVNLITPFHGDGALLYFWLFNGGTSVIKPAATKTVTFEYRAM